MNLHQANERIETAEQALALLKAGNERYLANDLADKGSYKADREILKSGQSPFAVIVTCSDSRVAPEIYFDQKLGDIFIIRNAGNIVDDTAMGSIQYAVEHLHSPLVVICGHSACGAVTAACDESGATHPAPLQSILDKIVPAKNPGDDVNTVIQNNIHMMADKVRNDDVIKHCGATVVGAHYDIHTGEVIWL